MTTPAASADAPLFDPHRRLGFLGPAGTFSEQALLTQDDLVQLHLVPYTTIPDVLGATDAGEVDLGFIPIENAIEGSVTVTLDLLAFDHDLLIEREVVIAVHLNLVTLPGVDIADIKTVVSYPHALAQCRAFLAEHLPGVQVQASNSTADAARRLAEDPDPTVGALAPARAADVYGLAVAARDIEDHPENATRFVVVGRAGVPRATGHDKTSIVVFQRTDTPGSLLGILQEFAARAINLTKLESRPTKKGLGDYCFLIDLEGHIGDPLVADCLRDLKSKVADVRFLGSYPAAGEHGVSVRRDAGAAWARADEWITSLRAQITD